MSRWIAAKSDAEYAFCGLGTKDRLPNQRVVVPFSVWQAKSNKQYQITPKRSYYITTRSFQLNDSSRAKLDQQEGL